MFAGIRVLVHARAYDRVCVRVYICVGLCEGRKEGRKSLFGKVYIISCYLQYSSFSLEDHHYYKTSRVAIVMATTIYILIKCNLSI